MIPNIFISSTIADLQYLRDGLRDAIDDLAYNPVMSEFGEVGYLNPVTAAESCYRTVKDCQMVVIIVGLRYGVVGPDGLSVTHREFRTAAENRIPTISFVEPQVLNFKQVYDADPSAVLWSSFKPMDGPKHTFELVSEIVSLDSYNGLIPFHSVSDAKQKLKRQIADFVGQRLGEVGSVMHRNLQEILAQISTLRTELAQRPNVDAQQHYRSQQHLVIMRFLLEDRHSSLRNLAELFYEELDAAFEPLMKCPDFNAFAKEAGVKPLVIDAPTLKEALLKAGLDEGTRNERMMYSTSNRYGGYQGFSDGTMVITKSMFDRFQAMFASLKSKLDQIPNPGNTRP